MKTNKIPEDWHRKKLGKVLTIRNGKDHKNLQDGKYPVLGTGGIMRYVDSYLYDQPSILIGRKGTIDKPQFITSPFWTVDTLFYSEISPDVIPFYLFLVVQSINWRKYNQATGVPSLTSTIINNVKVLLPPIAEQRKIAEILGTCDRLIELTEQLITAKRKLKRGLMQKLLKNPIWSKHINLDSLLIKDWKLISLSSLFTERKTTSSNLSETPLYSLTIEKGLIEKPEQTRAT